MNVSWPVVSVLCAVFGIAIGVAVPYVGDWLERQDWWLE